MTDLQHSTISEIVADDFRAAAVFQKYGLDFCCGGGRSVDDACRAKSIEPTNVLADLSALAETPSTGVPRFNTFELDMLANYIVGNHHRYILEMAPVILQHLQKVATVHGQHHPETLAIASTFNKVVSDLLLHMHKEEHVLFPYIRSLVEAKRQGGIPAAAPFGGVVNPITMMEQEHQAAGDEMAEIRRLTSNYMPPADACTTYRVSFKELLEFEADLHQHVHLENNILFPKAVALEAELLESVPAAPSCSFVPHPVY